jgi:hypothetical protein
MDSNPLFLTGNTDTVYCMVFLDLEADGPTVVEIPPGCGPGTVDDAFFRFVIDMGAPRPGSPRCRRPESLPKRNWLQTNPGKTWFAYFLFTGRWSPTWTEAGNYQILRT